MLTWPAKLDVRPAVVPLRLEHGNEALAAMMHATENGSSVIVL
ncbi:MAG: hypothetical protein WCC26_16395 [Terracidiphilus sp.]